jgi:3-deoxy-manno-octulosonate cytidylyltransferase (CMP-KDO synthetase)
MGSTRFPGKPLADLCGKPMVAWVVEAAQRAEVADLVIVATPDDEIMDACRKMGVEAVRTLHTCPTGTDRIAEAAAQVPADCYVNVQGDEPLVEPASIAACARPLLQSLEVEMASVYGRLDPNEESDPNAVKVVTDRQGYALYFSRSPIPFERNPRVEPAKKHVGLYAYRADALSRFSTWPQTPLEVAESLEQLRFLENGVRIKMEPGEATPLAVDTPAQAEQVRAILAERA